MKKAVAIGGSTAMAALTVASAMALNLNEYPAPFVNNGQANVKIVVGENADTADLVGAIDVASSLQRASARSVSSGGGSTTTLSGDVKQISDSGDILEIGEYIGSVVETLSDDDLEMLQSGRVSTQSGSTDFEQTIDLAAASISVTGDSGKVVLDENNDDEVGMFLFFDDNQPAFVYELSFTSGLESDLEGTAPDYDGEDIEDESIFMLGSYYTVTQVDVTDAASDDITLELLAGQVTDTLTQGETKTFTIDGKDYEVTVLAIGNSGDAVKFLVNGEVTDNLASDETDTLSDGLEIGVRDIIETTAYRESDPGSIVEFYLGANKVEITDLDIGTNDYGGTVDINEETIEDLDADIDAALTGTTDVEISSLIFKLTIDSADGQDIFLAEGEGLRENLDEPEGMLADTWDIVYQGMTQPDSTNIELQANGDESYDLVFVNMNGDEYTVPFYHANTSTDNDGVFGDEDDSLVFEELNAAGPGVIGDFNIDLDDYFVLTDIGGTGAADNGDDTYVLQFTDVNEDDDEVTFEDVATGQEMTETVTGTWATANASSPMTGQITIGGKDFDFQVFESGSEYLMQVDHDNSGAYENNDVVQIVVKGGGVLTPAQAAEVSNTVSAGNPSVAVGTGTVTLTLTTQADDTDNNTAQTVSFTLSETNDEVDVSALPSTSSAGVWFQETDNDADIQYAVNAYGTWFEKTDETDSSDSLVIKYPSEQVEALVYVVGGDVQKSVSAGTGGTVVVNPIGVGFGALDSEVKLDQTNMIVIGGPCANTIAAELLDSPAQCAEGFTEGKAMIKLFDTGNNVALLVAGYSAADTVAASRVIAEYADHDLAGMEAEVTVAGSKVTSVMSK